MSPLLITLAFLTVAPPNVSVQTIDGQTSKGALVALDELTVTIKSQNDTTAIKISSVAKIIQQSAAEIPGTLAGPWIELVDNTQLAASSFSVEDRKATIRLTGGDPLHIDRRHIRYARLKHQDAAIAEQWQKILATDADADLLVIRKRGKIDFLEGIVEDVDSTHVHFKFDGDVIPVKLEKVEGIVYHALARKVQPEPKAMFVSSDSSRFPATDWKLDRGTLSITTPLGISVPLSISKLNHIDLTSGKLAYLSDLAPTSSKWTPYIGGGDEMPLLEKMFRPRSDRAIDGGPLRLAGREHRKGLSIHSRTALSYELRGKYRLFKALAGIDDRMRDRGHVEVVIKADGEVLFTGAFSGSDEPRELDLDITNARRLEILVDYGKDLDIADHMNFVDARVLK